MFLKLETVGAILVSRFAVAPQQKNLHDSGSSRCLLSKSLGIQCQYSEIVLWRGTKNVPESALT